VESKHFFVVVVNFNKRTSSEGSDKFISDIIIYDSLVGTLMKRSRESAREHNASVLGLVKVINNFVNKYLLAAHSHEMLRQTDDELGEKLDFYSGPQQVNDVDCGLFCVGVVRHLLDDHAVDNTIFSHTDMSEMRKRLYIHFSQKVVNNSYSHINT
jgi:Ulp1 family protease